MSRLHETIRQRNCRIKKRYDTLPEAKSAADFYLKNNGTEFDAYECGNHFHLTRKVKS